ncbi:MAG: dioxygenase [Cellvibrionaceae bacterium]|nr:dioxygenase [Cellvibrionaceae bacterium]
MVSPYKALFLSHGGGPMPLLGDESHQEMIACLQQIATLLPKPDAMVIVSAHWEATVPTITAGANPPLIYDYYGFPPESYEIRYPCAGNPPLAQKIHQLLGAAGIDSVLDEERGFDHGVFVPMTILYPAADIPCVQLSLVKTLDPAQHIKIGRALQSLADENILLIGSGFSFHNMRAFFAPETAGTRALNHSFDEWLRTTCGAAGSEDAREQALIRWADAPGARFCHPREEHLVPLHVCYGFAQAPSSRQFELQILNKKSSMILW